MKPFWKIVLKVVVFVGGMIAKNQKGVNANDISAMQDILNKGTDSLDDKNKRNEL